MNLTIETTTFDPSFWDSERSHNPSRRYVSSSEQTSQVGHRIFEMLKQQGLSEESVLMGKVMNTSDVQGLWFLRADMMLNLSLLHGEAASRSFIGSISCLFEGLVPISLVERGHYVG